MCYYEGCKKGILFHWKSNGIACYGLQVRYWECFASVFIPVFGWICKCKYDQHLLCEFFSFLSFFLCFFPSVFLFRSHCFFNTYCSFLCYLECFLLLFYRCKCGNSCLYLPESPLSAENEGKMLMIFLSLCGCTPFEFCKPVCSFGRRSILVNMSLYK